MSKEAKDAPVSLKGDNQFEQRVWDVLSKTEVDDNVSYLPKTSKRPAIPYLPWHKAWLLVTREFPASRFEYQDHVIYQNGSMEVGVNVIIQSHRAGPARFIQCKLAVMNAYFGAIENPDAREANDARQRCLVKALAFAGLGLNLWSESIEPVGKLDEPITPEELATLMDLIEKTDSDMTAFLKWCKVDELVDLPYERLGSAITLLDSKLRRMSK